MKWMIMYLDQITHYEFFYAEADARKRYEELKAILHVFNAELWHREG